MTTPGKQCSWPTIVDLLFHNVRVAPALKEKQNVEQQTEEEYL